MGGVVQPTVEHRKRPCSTLHYPAAYNRAFRQAEKPFAEGQSVQHGAWGRPRIARQWRGKFIRSGGRRKAPQGSPPPRAAPGRALSPGRERKLA